MEAVTDSARRYFLEMEVCSQVFFFFVYLSLLITSRTPSAAALEHPTDGEISMRNEGSKMAYAQTTQDTSDF